MPKYGPVASIAVMGLIWNIVMTGIAHIKKCKPILGVNQYLPGARNRIFQAICLFPDIAQVLVPHNGSLLLSHTSLSFTKSSLLINSRAANNDIYINIKLGFSVKANSHKLKNNG